MSQNALPTTVTIGASFSVSFLVERMCRGTPVSTWKIFLQSAARLSGYAGVSLKF